MIRCIYYNEMQEGFFVLSQQLKIYLKVAEAGSLSKAAEQLYVTPASIMRQMNILENRLEVKLLIRTNHGIRLTPAGRQIYETAKRLEAEAATALTEAKAIEQNETKTIRIGSSFLRPGRALIDLWNQLSPSPGTYRFKLIPFDDNKDQILNVIDSLGSKMDFMVGSLNATQMLARADYLELGQYAICVAVPHSHPLAQQSGLVPEDLHGEKLIIVQSGDTTELDRLRQWISEAHPQIQILDTDFYYDINTFNYCEETGACLLTFEAWTDIHPSLVTLPVDWDFTAPYGLLYSQKINGVAKYFLNDLINILK